MVLNQDPLLQLIQDQVQEIEVVIQYFQLLHQQAVVVETHFLEMVLHLVQVAQVEAAAQQIHQVKELLVQVTHHP